MPSTIKAEEQQIMRVFSNDYAFLIPEYQRPYTWTTEETGELLDDLIYAMGQNTDVSEASPYFLGSIVVIKEPDLADAQVIDGQQRLTTLTILVAVLRDLCKGTDNHHVLDEYMRQRGNTIEGTDDRFRINIRPRDQKFFQENVQTPGCIANFINEDSSTWSDSRQRIHENTQLLHKELSGKDTAYLTRLASFIARRCYLVVVSASDQKSAYRVFSVMNDRGLDLSPTDILKAEIIANMADSGYTDKWEDTEDALGRDGFRDLFTHIRMIYMKDKARRALNDEFQTGVLDKLNGLNFIDDVLEPFADVYQAILGASFESSSNADEINRYLKYLGRLDNFDWIPPAMAFFKQAQADSAAILQFTKDLERLAYGMFIRRANINERINRYAKVLDEIERGNDLSSDSSSLQLTSDEKSAILNVLGGEIYWQTRVRMPLLLRLDSLLADAGATYEYSIISVEHVLPQHPRDKSEWVRWFTDEERTHWTHRLANLVLLSRRKNSSASNYDFNHKKERYFQRKGVAPFALTSQVLNVSEWTPEILERRQQSLITRLKEEWRL